MKCASGENATAVQLRKRHLKSTEQEGWQGRLSGSNTLGRGQAEGWTPFAINPERAPAEVHLYQLRFSYGDSAGAR